MRIRDLAVKLSRHEDNECHLLMFNERLVHQRCDMFPRALYIIHADPESDIDAHCHLFQLRHALLLA